MPLPDVSVTDEMLDNPAGFGNVFTALELHYMLQRSVDLIPPEWVGRRKMAGVPYFTGFKHFFPQYPHIYRLADETILGPAKYEDIRYCGQWIWAHWDKGWHEGKIAVVTVPSLTSGIYDFGSDFDIGTEFFSAETTQSQIEEATRAGFMKLCNLIGGMFTEHVMEIVP